MIPIKTFRENTFSLGLKHPCFDADFFNLVYRNVVAWPEIRFYCRLCRRIYIRHWSLALEGQRRTLSFNKNEDTGFSVLSCQFVFANSCHLFEMDVWSVWLSIVACNKVFKEAAHVWVFAMMGTWLFAQMAWESLTVRPLDAGGGKERCEWVPVEPGTAAAGDNQGWHAEAQAERSVRYNGTPHALSPIVPFPDSIFKFSTNGKFVMPKHRLVWGSKEQS